MPRSSSISTFVRAYNNRGVAYRKKGERERALADFEQAIRLDPRFDDAVTNRDEVREEIKQLALVSKVQLPTFDCTRAKLAVEKAICSDPDLAQLDRAIDQAYLEARAKLSPASAAALRRDQRDFIARRNKSFGRPSYQIRKELEQRLTALREFRRLAIESEDLRPFPTNPPNGHTRALIAN